MVWIRLQVEGQRRTRNVTAVLDSIDPRDAKSEVRTIQQFVRNFFEHRRSDTPRNPTTHDDTQ